MMFIIKQIFDHGAVPQKLPLSLPHCYINHHHLHLHMHSHSASHRSSPLEFFCNNCLPYILQHYLHTFSLVYHSNYSNRSWKSTSPVGNWPIIQGFGLTNTTRKYCLICHVYKPERTHHCSSCSRCVLNMDHHWYKLA